MGQQAPATGFGNISQMLGLGQTPARRRWRWGAVIAVVVLAVGAGVWLSGGKEAVGFRTAEVRTGDLVVKVTATGVLKPVNQVEVGTEISGTIESVRADYNMRVKRGDELARLDTDRLEAQVIQAQASLASARAKREEAGATVKETRVRLARCEALAKRQLCSREERDTLHAASLRAQATETSARAQIAVAEAALRVHQTDLDKAVIRAPVDGIVLKRQIEPGQTVAASLQTPVLFLLAENLAQMELQVAVDEADVGQVKEGQQAMFSVDAYPDRTFPAAIREVHFAPETVEGVVTYGTVLSVDNADLTLRPGMTATAEIVVNKLENILLIPNEALRFKPPAGAEAERASSRSVFSMLFPRPGSSTVSKSRKPAATNEKTRTVWILEDGKPAAVQVRIGASNGSQSQVLEGELQAGQEVLVDVVSKGK